MTEMFKKIVFFEDLSDEAKEKAREWFKETEDKSYELDVDLTNYIEDAIAEAGYKLDGFVKVWFSLSSCQGDGVSFEATFSKGEKIFEAYKTDHHYQHEYTFNVRELFQDGENTDDEKVTEEMRAIAKKAEKYGYEQLEFLDSDQVIDEKLIENEYTFTIEGVQMDCDTIIE